MLIPNKIFFNPKVGFVSDNHLNNFVRVDLGLK